MSESDTVSITPPANPMENAIIRARGRLNSRTTRPPSPVERPASVVSVSANSINISPFPHLYAGAVPFQHPAGEGFSGMAGQLQQRRDALHQHALHHGCHLPRGDGHLFLQPALQHADAAGYDEGIYIIIGVPPVAAELRAPFVQHA